MPDYFDDQDDAFEIEADLNEPDDIDGAAVYRLN